MNPSWPKRILWDHVSQVAGNAIKTSFENAPITEGFWPPLKTIENHAQCRSLDQPSLCIPVSATSSLNRHLGGCKSQSTLTSIVAKFLCTTRTLGHRLS
jgi:hypothetical protein